MGTNKIISFLLFIFFIPFFILKAQTGYVPAGHPVYDFLERMDALQIIDGFNSLERPQTRHDIAKLIVEINEHTHQLSVVDRNMLNDFLSEFEYEMSGKLNISTSLVKDGLNDRYSQKEKYLFTYSDSGRAAFFVNLLAEAQNIIRYDLDKKTSESSLLGYYGGAIRGSLINRFSFLIRGINGRVWGNKDAAKLNRDVRYNYKYNLDVSDGQTFYDVTEGYLSAEFDLVKFKIGRDQLNFGYGPFSNILGYSAPQFDYLSFSFMYKIIDFSFFHGKLLGSTYSGIDSLQGVVKKVTDKYLVYHRMGFNISKHFALGLGEMLIYSDRPIDLSYLNPFNFYKTTEHTNQDRDNSLMFFDASNNSIEGLKFYTSLLIDDMDFGKIGKNWYGNQTTFNFTVYSANLYRLVPVDLYFQYLRAEPYMYTQRIKENNFTSGGFSLMDPLQPNSYLIALSCRYRPYYRLSITADFSYMKHGANPVEADGTIRNVGGDINTGYRLGDSQEVSFLDGDMEYYRAVSLSAVFEPLKNYYISYRAVLERNSLQNSVRRNFISSYFVVNVRI